MHAGLSAFSSYQNVRATILGLGTFGGGVAAAKFLAERGAQVTITDRRSESQLSDSLSQLQNTSLKNVWLNGHPAQAFRDCELLVVNPAVSPEADVWSIAQQHNPVQTTELGLFLHHCPAKTVAVTGSNGKSTTAALIHHLLQKNLNGGRSFLGGNIGESLLPIVADLSPHDVAVLEVSSFQLHYLRQHNFAPDVAVITNLSPNHLDWHPTLQHYRDAKQVVLDRQQKSAVAVLPSEHDVNVAQPIDNIAAWRVRCECLRFGIHDCGEDGVFFDDGLLIFRRGQTEDAVRWQAPASLPGRHNQANVAAACAAAWSLGSAPQQMTADVRSYAALPHRLQTVAHFNDRRFINDSVATTPESGIAALQAVTGPTVIIAGGADKGLNLEPFATAIINRATAAVLIGQTGSDLQHLIAQDAPQFPTKRYAAPEDFAAAVRTAVELSHAGGIVLLSPGCASYGWFRDYRHRGEQFVRIAQQLNRPL